MKVPATATLGIYFVAERWKDIQEVLNGKTGAVLASEKKNKETGRTVKFCILLLNFMSYSVFHAICERIQVAEV